MPEVSARISATSGPPAPNCSPIVFVVDDDVSSRKHIELLTAAMGWRVRAFASAEEFLACPRALAPSCLVLNLRSLELQRRLRYRPEIPIIFITDLADVPMTVQAMRAGAVGVLTKPVSGEELRSAIELALERSLQVIDQGLGMRQLRHRYASLTVREREVMGLVVSGLMNKQTGEALGISVFTVKIHRTHLMRKLGARSLAELIKMALRLDSPYPSPRVAPPLVNHYFARGECELGFDDPSRCKAIGDMTHPAEVGNLTFVPTYRNVVRGDTHCERSRALSSASGQRPPRAEP